MKDIEGGVSAVAKAVLTQGFANATPHDMREAGITLELRDGTSVWAFFKFQALLADEDALRMI